MEQMRIRINRLKSGMIIKDNIYSKTGTFLIGSGTVVTQEIIELLTKHFYSPFITNLLLQNYFFKLYSLIFLHIYYTIYFFYFHY